MAVLVILEINRLPLYRRIDPSKVRRDEPSGTHDARLETTGPTTSGEAGDERTPPEE